MRSDHKDDACEIRLHGVDDLRVEFTFLSGPESGKTHAVDIGFKRPPPDFNQKLLDVPVEICARAAKAKHEGTVQQQALTDAGSDKGLSTWTIIGIAAGAEVVLVAIFFIVRRFCCNKGSRPPVRGAPPTSWEAYGCGLSSTEEPLGHVKDTSIE